MMSEMIFQKPAMLWLLPSVGLLLLIYRVRVARRKKDIRAFGEDAAWRGLEHHSMEWWRLLLLVGACALVILALARPAANPHPRMLQREGRDVVFLLDVSKSMLAEDRLPNRLQSAKTSIAECVSELDDHRLGLVVFAGSSSIACPLTEDKDFFLNSLDRVGPDTVAHGGTRVGDALLKVCDKLFSDSAQGYKDIVLLTDGGEQGENLDYALEVVNEKQVKLIAIGLGDASAGARIPQVGEQSDYMTYKGQEVWSKLDVVQLRNMVKQADRGAFLAVGTRQMKLGDIYQRISDQEGKQQLAEESVIDYDELYQWLIALAFILLVVMILMPHSMTRRTKKNWLTAAVLMLAGLPDAQAAGVEGGDAAYARGDFQQALEIYQSAATSSAAARLWYKKGNAEYRLELYESAQQSFAEALGRQPGSGLIRDITYNLGNTYYRLSGKAEDSYTALSLVSESVRMYRRVLLQNPQDRDAAMNMELAKIERHKLQQKIQKEEQRRAELKQALEDLKTAIEKAAAAQAKTLKLTDAHLIDDQAEQNWEQTMQKEEQEIISLTEKAVELVDATSKKFFDGIPAEASPLRASRDHLNQAEEFESAAEAYLIHNPHAAHVEEGLALENLHAALDALPSDPDDAEQQAEDGEAGDEEGEGEEGDEEGEEGDQESEGDSEAQSDSEPADANQMNLESMELPPPNDTPEDVIRKNATMQEARQAQGAKKKGNPVEKDW
ncbi:VWA domain-containing protein [Verrucomicrobiaceae bacterium 5K15]|uniref:VWA domain-containing protein n=1 Tax=Oceaniferula flava TaxID=2800421 RepID=A0AAE2SC67_9BACT|nr:VWA domain-containing protein [Oceaniferula flavus]MBK1854327.1 VWA domain-containing protein [Oceaniferula flavus]MBM1135633.1 VWA domain-containing protein [Oceaniferula flavus]